MYECSYNYFGQFTFVGHSDQRILRPCVCTPVPHVTSGIHMTKVFVLFLLMGQAEDRPVYFDPYNFHIYISYIFRKLLNKYICIYMCNELRVIWPVPHEILSVITRSTIIT